MSRSHSPIVIVGRVLLALVLVLLASEAKAQTPAEAVVIAGEGSVYYIQADSGTTFAEQTGSDGLAATNPAFTAGDFSAAAQTNGNAGVVTSGMTIYPKSFGINSLFFASKNLGVAVGALQSAGITTPGTVGYPNILMTIDQGVTWMSVTGGPAVTSTAAVSAVPSTSAPYPPVAAGDFTSVYFHDKSMGWAVGGNSISLALKAYAAPTALSAAATIPVGYALRTTNGGTVWQNVPLFFTKVRADIAFRSAGQEAASLFSASVPGILFSVQADAKAKCVYAVGSSLHTMRWTGGAVTVQTGVSGTVMTSTTSGLSWVTKAGPVLMGATTAPGYSLFGVAALSEDEAVAVGGSPTVPEGFGSSGVIVRTVNQGLSWMIAQFPGAGTASVPALVGIAQQPKTDNVWVGGYVTASNTAATLANGAEYYPVNYDAGGFKVPRTVGVIYTLLLSNNRGVSFSAAPEASFPAGFVQTSRDGTAPSVVNNVFGIVWDNSKHGFIYGTRFILETHDSGNTWTYATPPGLIVGSNSGSASALASVPSGR